MSSATVHAQSGWVRVPLAKQVPAINGQGWPTLLAREEVIELGNLHEDYRKEGITWVTSAPAAR